MGLFDKEYKFVGKHATYCRYLKDEGIIKTFREVYLISTAVGYLNNATSPVDKEEKVQEASILPSELMQQKDNLTFLYRIIMLTREVPGYSIDDYKNRAFRDDVDDENPEKVKENMELFNSYSRAGVEILYDIFKDGTNRKDYANQLNTFLTNFCMDINLIQDDEEDTF